MTRKLTKEFFENRKQQIEIKSALDAAIPPGIYYHNLIIALAGMLTWAVNEAYKDDVYKKHVEVKNVDA